MSTADLSEYSMLELFRLEAENQVQVLTAGLLVLERDPAAADQLEACMRAAHSLKGAARIVGLSVTVGVAHAMEDCFVAAQKGHIRLRRKHIDRLLCGVDLLARMANTPDAEAGKWAEVSKKSEVDALLAELARVLASAGEVEEPDGDLPPVAARAPGGPPPAEPQAPVAAAPGGESADRVLRVTAEHLNRLLGLAGESLIETRWLQPFGVALLRLKRLQDDVGRALDSLHGALAERALDEHAQGVLADAQRGILECRQYLSQRLGEIEVFEHRSTDLSHRLYDEARACRMRPFADGVQGFPRLVRDVALSLGKQVRLDIIGEATQVDRDILEKLEAVLGHLLHNAIDHGIESAEERRAAGKAAEGVVRLEARHSAGALQIIVADDGCGIPLDRLREAVVARHLTSAEAAHALSDAELLQFLFLPGFTLKASVTEISGRGVGLDAVQDMVKQVRGTVRVSSQPGRGTRFQLQLPVALSVVRTLVVDIGGQPYAFPLASVGRTLKLPKEKIEILEGHQHFSLDGKHIGLVTAHQVFESGEPTLAGDELPVIVVSNHSGSYGLVVDRFLGERELVAQPLDAQLGKIKDIAAGALMEDGAPVLIVDTEDMIRSVERLVAAGRLSAVQHGAGGAEKLRKRVLVVDDSLTVRELERKLLGNRGYGVEVAVDGMDGWNAVRAGRFDLIITDIDMPRMDGIELVTLIKKDPNVKSLPVMVVSYKDREEDRQRGLDAGADYYLTKGSFHDETLLQAVVDLIGEADA